MKITLTNGRTFIVKVHYTTEDKQSYFKDEYGREHYTIWDEKTTDVTIYEWTKNLNDTKVIIKGYAKCSYKDQFNKRIGRKMAYYNAVTKMVELGLINEQESVEFDTFDLDCSEFLVTPNLVKKENINE